MEGPYRGTGAGSRPPPQRIEQRDQLPHRVDGDEGGRERLRKGSAVCIGPRARQPDGRTVAQLDQQVLLTILQDREGLTLEGMVLPCDGDLVQCAAAIVIRSVC